MLHHRPVSSATGRSNNKHAATSSGVIASVSPCASSRNSVHYNSTAYQHQRCRTVEAAPNSAWLALLTPVLQASG
jgi:hypothetical protein